MAWAGGGLAEGERRAAPRGGHLGDQKVRSHKVPITSPRKP